MSRSPYIRAMIGSLRDRIATWCQDFLTQALSIGSDAFKTYSRTRARFGLTPAPAIEQAFLAISETLPPCGDVASIHPSRTRPARQSRPGLTDAWMSTIIEPLIAATRGETIIDEEDIAA